MSVKLLTEHNFEFLSLKGGCAGLSESTLVEMPHCWKSHVVAQMLSGPLKVNFWIHAVMELVALLYVYTVLRLSLFCVSAK